MTFEIFQKRKKNPLVLLRKCLYTENAHKSKNLIFKKNVNKNYYKFLKKKRLEKKSEMYENNKNL